MSEELKKALEKFEEKKAEFNEVCSKEPPDCVAIAEAYEEVGKALKDYSIILFRERGWSPEKIDEELKKRRW